MPFEKWDQWGDIHGSADQKKRIASAKKAENTPVSIDQSARSGSFSGSHGHYTAQLDHCTCGDFIRRKLPCKHIYRLAIELGAFGDKTTVASSQGARKVPKSERMEQTKNIVAKIENYTDAEQLEIKEILLGVLYHKRTKFVYKDTSPISTAIADGLLVTSECYDYFIRKMLKRDMVKAIADHGDTLPAECKLAKDIATWMLTRKDIYGPNLFPNAAEVRLSDELAQHSQSVYRYLHRKFDESAHQEMVIDPETGEISVVETGLAGGFETKLLDLFGTNPTKKP